MFGDVNNPGPSVGFTQPTLGFLRQLESHLPFSVQELKDFIEDISEEVFALPPEKRFESAGDIILEAVEENPEIPRGIQRVFGTEYYSLLVDLIDFVEEPLVEQILEEPHPSQLVILDTFGLMRELAEAIDYGQLDREEKRQFASAVLVLYLRLYRETEMEETGSVVSIARENTRARNILLEHRLADDIRLIGPLPVENLSDKQVLQSSRAYGAARLYQLRDISVGKGAELANTTQRQFLGILDLKDSEPSFGPDSREGLFSGPELLNE